MPTGEAADELREWLTTHARLPAARVQPLMAALAEQWVEDVPGLRHAIDALEAHLPAAAYGAISKAIERGL